MSGRDWYLGVLVARCVVFTLIPVVLGYALWVLVSNSGVPARSLLATGAGLVMWLLVGITGPDFMRSAGGSAQETSQDG